MEKKILVVDDEKPTLDMLDMLLEGYGYKVFTALNGEEALEVYLREKPPIVLTDIKMPIMDGMEVLSRIKETNPLAEVIVVTGHGDMDLAIKALNLDATDFINKPVQRRALDQALKRAEDRIRMAREDEEKVAADVRESAVVVTVKGRVTSTSEPFFQTAFGQALKSGKDKVVVRFMENASINGAGIALITQHLMECRDAGVKVIFAGVNENLRKVFGIVGITRLVEIKDTMEEALSS